MNNGAKNIQAAAYNGACTVDYSLSKISKDIICSFDFGTSWNSLTVNLLFAVFGKAGTLKPVKCHSYIDGISNSF